MQERERGEPEVERERTTLDDLEVEVQPDEAAKVKGGQTSTLRTGATRTSSPLANPPEISSLDVPDT